jgi:hypothetical protein
MLSQLDKRFYKWYLNAMFRRYITSPIAIRILLILQIVPILALPPTSYSLKTQEWWLPAFLALLTILSLIKLLPRRSIAPWPWYLLGFSQGFNIISRMMTLFPHATAYSEGSGMVVNALYIALSIASMLFSGFELLYCELPEVRQRMLPKAQPEAAA